MTLAQQEPPPPPQGGCQSCRDIRGFERRIEKVGKDAVMQADRDGRAGGGGPGETEEGKRWRRRIKGGGQREKHSPRERGGKEKQRVKRQRKFEIDERNEKREERNVR